MNYFTITLNEYFIIFFEAWTQHDEDGNGKLDAAEAKEAFQLFFKSARDDEEISDAEVEKYLARFDTDKSGTLDKSEFVAVIKAYLSEEGKV